MNSQTETFDPPDRSSARGAHSSRRRGLHEGSPAAREATARLCFRSSRLGDHPAEAASGGEAAPLRACPLPDVGRHPPDMISCLLADAARHAADMGSTPSPSSGGPPTLAPFHRALASLEASEHPSSARASSKLERVSARARSRPRLRERPLRGCVAAAAAESCTQRQRRTPRAPAPAAWRLRAPRSRTRPSRRPT